MTQGEIDTLDTLEDADYVFGQLSDDGLFPVITTSPLIYHTQIWKYLQQWYLQTRTTQTVRSSNKSFLTFLTFLQ
jgi:hypothetical protein